MTENYRDGANPADALARVERGERVEITRNGSRVAVLVPAQPDPLSGLIESGDSPRARCAAVGVGNSSVGVGFCRQLSYSAR